MIRYDRTCERLAFDETARCGEVRGWFGYFSGCSLFVFMSGTHCNLASGYSLVVALNMFGHAGAYFWNIFLLLALPFLHILD